MSKRRRIFPSFLLLPRAIVVTLLALVLSVVVACSDDTGPTVDAAAGDLLSVDQASVEAPISDDLMRRDLSHPEAGVDATHDALVADLASVDAGPPPNYPAPIAYWPMNAADVKGTALAAKRGSFPGKLVGGVTVDAQGRVQGALKLDGTSGFVDFGDVMNTVFAGPGKTFSVSFWIKPRVSGKSMVLFGKSADTSCDPDEDERMWVSALGTTGVVSLTYQKKVAGHAKLMMGKTVLTGGGSAWRHLVFVYDGSAQGAPIDRVAIYVDGTKETLKPLSLGDFPFDLEATKAHLAFGVRTSSQGKACTDSGAGLFVGSVDELAIWDRALGAADAKELFDRGVAGRPVAR